MDSDPFRHTFDTILKRFIMFYLITIPPVSIVTFTGYSGILRDNPQCPRSIMEWPTYTVSTQIRELWHKKLTLGSDGEI